MQMSRQTVNCSSAVVAAAAGVCWRAVVGTTVRLHGQGQTVPPRGLNLGVSARPARHATAGQDGPEGREGVTRGGDGGRVDCPEDGRELRHVRLCRGKAGGESGGGET